MAPRFLSSGGIDNAVVVPQVLRENQSSNSVITEHPCKGGQWSQSSGVNSLGWREKYIILCDIVFTYENFMRRHGQGLEELERAS